MSISSQTGFTWKEITEEIPWVAIERMLADQVWFEDEDGENPKNKGEEPMSLDDHMELLSQINKIPK